MLIKLQQLISATAVLKSSPLNLYVETAPNPAVVALRLALTPIDKFHYVKPIQSFLKKYFSSEPFAQVLTFSSSSYYNFTDNR
jgi:hypothetical protein